MRHKETFDLDLKRRTEFHWCRDQRRIHGHGTEGQKHTNWNDHKMNTCSFKECKQYKSILSQPHTQSGILTSFIIHIIIYVYDYVQLLFYKNNIILHIFSATWFLAHTIDYLLCHYIQINELLHHILVWLDAHEIIMHFDRTMKFNGFYCSLWFMHKNTCMLMWREATHVFYPGHGTESVRPTQEHILLSLFILRIL